MIKYKALKPFMDFEKGVGVKRNEVVEFEKVRAAELIKNLEKFGGGFLEEIKQPKKKATKKEGE